MVAKSKSDSMKKVNWTEVSRVNLSKECFWTNQEDLAVADDVLAGLTEKFSLPNKIATKTTVGKPAITLHVLDASRAQTLLILLRVFWKNVSIEQIKKYILQCDISMLNVEFNEGLIKCLPKPHEMTKFHQVKKKKN